MPNSGFPGKQKRENTAPNICSCLFTTLLLSNVAAWLESVCTSVCVCVTVGKCGPGDTHCSGNYHKRVVLSFTPGVYARLQSFLPPKNTEVLQTTQDPATLHRCDITIMAGFEGGWSQAEVRVSEVGRLRSHWPFRLSRFITHTLLVCVEPLLPSELL